MSSSAVTLPRAPRHLARALWGLELDIAALPRAAEVAPGRPRFVGSRVFLPAEPLAGVGGAFSDYLLAATAHAAAHIAYGAGARFRVGSLKPAQVAIISLLEDARIEQLAAERYPGLWRLWEPYFEARTSGPKTSVALLARLARALHDQAYDDDDAWVDKARQAFFAARSAWNEPNTLRELGGRLGNDWGQMRVQFNARDYAVLPAYRDDHVGLWQFDAQKGENGTELELEAARRSERTSSIDSPQTTVATHLLTPTQTGITLEARAEGSASPELPILYPEWDYVIGVERPAFTSVHERPAPVGDCSHLRAALERHAPTRRGLQRAAARLGSESVRRERRLRDGDRLELSAAIAALVARVSGTRPEPRVYQRLDFRREPPALLVLLDCSESLNSTDRRTKVPVLEHARLAAATLATALHSARIASDFAIHGFCSNGRRDVHYSRFKDFDEAFDERAQLRLAGMRAGLSTRLGAALRHSARALHARRARRKLLLVVSDGEPSDVDVHDSKYLLLDAKRAVVDSRARGLRSFCLGLDPSAEDSLRCIFGIGNYLLTNRPERLPEVLGRLCLELGR